MVKKDRSRCIIDLADASLFQVAYQYLRQVMFMHANHSLYIVSLIYCKTVFSCN